MDKAYCSLMDWVEMDSLAIRMYLIRYDFNLPE